MPDDGSSCGFGIDDGFGIGIGADSNRMPYDGSFSLFF
jgi:hypothetical protein